MRRVPLKPFAAILLALCVGVHLLEVSGRWDDSFSDANDEAGIVAIVLCIGIAISAAASVLKRLLAPTLRGITLVRSVGSACLPAFRFPLPVSVAGPPLIPLRV